jgi:hypothetical protein
MGDIIRRPSKTIKLDVDENWNVTYGTFNNKKPKTVYAIICSWLKPLNNDFMDTINILERFVKRYKIGLNNTFQDRLISNFDIAQSKMRVNKRSQLKIKLHLIQNECKSFLDIKENVSKIILDMINKIYHLTKGEFEFSKKGRD